MTGASGPAETAVLVELPDGSRVVLRERAAEVVVWITAQMAELNALEFGQLRFDCAPGDTKPYLGRHFAPIKRRPAR